MAKTSAPMHVITGKNKIKKLQAELGRRLCRGRQMEGKFGYQGEHGELKIHWFPKEKFWWSYDPPEPGNRHWNAFGYEDEFDDTKGHSITCEINFPKSVGTWSIAGAFVENSDGKIYIVHSGKIGGGRKGISMKKFKQFHSEDHRWTDVEKDGKLKNVFVVSPLYDRLLIRNIGRFVKDVHCIKKRIVESS